MILVRPAAPNFTFPVGRYALVIKSTAYDFSVEAARKEWRTIINNATRYKL